MKILLVEDDTILVEALVRALTAERYTVDVANDGQTGWELASAYDYDLILLDVMLPKLDGISVCRKLRSQGSQSSILLLTAQDASSSKVVGLDAGADDYMTKPFNLAELLARIRALQRRESSTQLLPNLTWEDLSLDPSTREVTHQGTPIRLRPREYDLLELLLRNPQRVFSRGAILDHLWSFGESPGEETVTAHIKGLRQHLKAAGVRHDPIETVYGIGYRLHAETSTLSAQTAQQANTVTAAIWERAKHRLSERIAVIEKATTAGASDALADDLRRDAEREAHKLAGSLGMFNFDHGSRLAQQAEQAFQNWTTLPDQERAQLSSLIGQLRQTVQRVVHSDTPTLFYPKSAPPQGSALMPHAAHLLIISTDKRFQSDCAQALTQTAHDWTLQVESKPTVVPLSNHRPDIVLLDLAVTDENKTVRLTPDMVAFLAELQTLTPPVPVLLRTDQDSLLDRVKASRLGGRGFIPSTVPATAVIETVIDLWMRSHTDIAKVLVVDDDPQILEAMGQLLKPWGLKVFTLVDPRLFWDVFNDTRPDVLVLDVEMPHVDGLALCQVVRSDLQWNHIPILFLTAHTDDATKHQVFEVGADDYVSKPIVGPELVTRILNRLERSRLTQSQIKMDTLTRLANRRHAIQAITQTLAMGHQHRQQVCLALLSVNHLEQINHQYGYDMGDKVLVHFAHLLHQTFVGDDVVGRWSGRLFVVAMYGLSLDDGKRRLAKLQQQQTPLSIPEHPTSDNNNPGEAALINISVGLVVYPDTDLADDWPVGDCASLIATAMTQLEQNQ